MAGGRRGQGMKEGISLREEGAVERMGALVRAMEGLVKVGLVKVRVAKGGVTEMKGVKVVTGVMVEKVREGRVTEALGMEAEVKEVPGRVMGMEAGGMEAEVMEVGGRVKGGMGMEVGATEVEGRVKGVGEMEAEAEAMEAGVRAKGVARMCKCQH